MGDDSNAIRLCMRENMRKLHLIRAEGFQTRLEINILERGMSIQTQTDILQITTTVIYSKRSSTPWNAMHYIPGKLSVLPDFLLLGLFNNSKVTFEESLPRYW